MEVKDEFNFTVKLTKDDKGRFHGDPLYFPEDLDGSMACISILCKGRPARTYPIFQQDAMVYGNYSEYVKLHGCACCSLSTLLSAYCEEYKYYTPQYTIENVEREVLSLSDWRDNYSKPLVKQSPLTLYGISQVLSRSGVSSEYVPHFSRAKAIRTIRTHLETGRPVVVETSRVRYKKGLPVTISDRKFAGSYHTTILLAIEPDGNTVWMADSANRRWAGRMQRLKRVSLKELMNYMFPNMGFIALPSYFRNRFTAGGFLLID